MPLAARENFLRNATFQGHEWIPSLVAISQAYWHTAREEAEEICLRHPRMFPNFQKGKIDFDAGWGDGQEKRARIDAWGCEWQHELGGLEGIVTKGPLEDWDALDSWKPPSPPLFGEKQKLELERLRTNGHITACHLEHGFFFMRLYYLRGFENFMLDVALEDPRLDQLARIVENYWRQIIEPHVEAGVDMIAAADDLGTQTASMLGPQKFRRWLMPAYKRMFLPARSKGIHVSMHHDGYVMDIMDEIIECGVNIVNLQDLVNGIDNLAREVKGRVCINLDIDRQKVLPFGSPDDVRDLVKEEVMKLGSPQGGLQFVAGIYPPTPLENLDALLGALEEFQTYWVNQ